MSKQKLAFRWCSDCSYFENCYEENFGPNFLVPGCGKGPVPPNNPLQPELESSTVIEVDKPDK